MSTELLWSKVSSTLYSCVSFFNALYHCHDILYVPVNNLLLIVFVFGKFYIFKLVNIKCLCFYRSNYFYFRINEGKLFKYEELFL